MARSLTDINVADNEYTPIIYQGYTSKIAPFNANLLASSIAQYNDTQEKLSKQKTALDVALADIQTKLYGVNDKSNPEMHNFWVNYKQDLENKLKEYADNLDIRGALKFATESAGDIVKDSRLLTRIEASTNYKTKLELAREMRNKNLIDDDEYEYWKDKNPFNFTEETDNYGNVTDYTSYEDLELPFADFDLLSNIEQAFRDVTPYKTSNYSLISNGVSGASRDAIEYRDTQGVSKKAIMDNLYDRINNTPNAKQAIQQKINAKYDKYKKLLSEYLANPNENIANQLRNYSNYLQNGGKIDLDDYINKTVDKTAENLHYHYSDTHITNTGAASGKGSGKEDDDKQQYEPIIVQSGPMELDEEEQIGSRKAIQGEKQ